MQKVKKKNSSSYVENIKRVTGGLRKFVIRSIIILYSLNIIMMIQSRIMCLPGDITYTGVGNVYSMFIKKRREEMTTLST
jgi:hypothetical protein